MSLQASIDDYHFLFKIMLVGDSGVGKSSLLMRICEEPFNPAFFPTIGVDFKIKTLHEDPYITKLHIWDTAGQERFKAITTAYYRGAHGAFIVFDLTNAESFKNLENWITDIENYKTKSIISVIVGNKCDLADKREISYETAKQFADSFGMKYVETSAKDDVNVKKIIKEMSDDLQKGFHNKKPLIDEKWQIINGVKLSDAKKQWNLSQLKQLKDNSGCKC